MSASDSRIAVIEGADSATVQKLFAEAVTRWRARGVRVVGLIEETHGLPGRTCNAGILRDVVSNAPFSIYLEVPRADTSCHIDAKGAEAAGASVLDQIKSCDLVVLSKFGKLEAAQGGLYGAFEAAVAAGKPVLTTVSEKHRDAWRSFAPAASVLEPSPAAIETWWTTCAAGPSARDEPLTPRPQARP